MSRAEIKKHFDAMVDFAGDESSDTPVKRYSSGMHVRLALLWQPSWTGNFIVDEVLR